MGKIQDITGLRFGKLVAISRVGANKKGEGIWLCQCDCGNRSFVVLSNLKNGHTTSCGCYKQVCSRTHNETKTRLHHIWAGMKARCYNNKIPKYKDYGGRGITVCDEWRSDYIAFKEWAINNGYKESLTIDRINVDGNYEPSNCRWATAKQQANNKRNCNYITYENKTMTIKEWAEIIGVKSSALWKRIFVHNMPLEKALKKGDYRYGKRKIERN